MDKRIPNDERLSRSPKAVKSRHPDLRTILFLIIVALVTRLPFHAKYLTKWDSCNFAFALEHFNLGDHAPHPPGYPFYVGSAALINRLLHDANLSYIVLGIILCCIASIFIFLIGRMLFGYREGLFASLLFIVSPPAWYLSATALSYMSDAALISVVVYLALVGHEHRDLVRPWRWMPFVLGTGAGFRIPGFILCLPVYFLHLLDLNWRRRFFSVLTVVIIVVAGYGWVILATGGWGEYMRVTGSESVKHGEAFQRLLQSPVQELSRNISQIVLFLRQSFGPLWFLVFLPLAFPVSLLTRMTRRKGILWAAGLPSVLLFAFVYINYTAIMLVLLPVLALWMVHGIGKFSRWVVGLFLREPGVVRVRYGATLFTILWLAVAVLAGWQYISVNKSGGSGEKSAAAEGIHEYNIGEIYEIDRYIEDIIDVTSKFDPSRTCLLMYMETKHVGYYLRDYHVIWDKYLIRFPTRSPEGIFGMYGGRRVMYGSSYEEVGNSIVFETPLPGGCSTLIFRDDILRQYIPAPGLEASRVGEDQPFYQVSGIPDGWGIVVERYLGTPGGENPPPPSWSIGPLKIGSD